MNRIIRVLGVCAVFYTGLALADQIKVTGNRVNVRAVADPRSEIVGQVLRDDLLEATGRRQAGMVEIVPPKGVAAWVYGELVRDGAVAAKSVRVRSGPGIGYRSIGKLTQGERVKVIKQTGDWIQIEPPKSCRVWISADYVENPQENTGLAESGGGAQSTAQPEKKVVKTPEPMPAVIHNEVPEVHKKPEPVVSERPLLTEPPPRLMVRGEPAEVNKPAVRDRADQVVVNARRSEVVEPVVKPAIRPVVEQVSSRPAKPVIDTQPVISKEEVEAVGVARVLNLVPGVPQGQPVTVFGEVKMVGFLPLRRPSSYRLIITGGYQKTKPSCYLLGDTETIRRYLNKKVRVAGKKYWVRGVNDPAIMISEICPPEKTATP